MTGVIINLKEVI